MNSFRLPDSAGSATTVGQVLPPVSADRFKSCIAAAKAFDAQLAAGNYTELTFFDVAAIHTLLPHVLFNPQHDQADYGKLIRKQDTSGKPLRVTGKWVASIMRCDLRKAYRILESLEEHKVTTRSRAGRRGNPYVTSMADWLNRLHLDSPLVTPQDTNRSISVTPLRKPKLISDTRGHSHTEEVSKEEELVPEAVTDLRSPSAPSGTDHIPDQIQDQVQDPEPLAEVVPPPGAGEDPLENAGEVRCLADKATGQLDRVNVRRVPTAGQQVVWLAKDDPRLAAHREKEKADG
jgi:hypothetical protein